MTLRAWPNVPRIVLLLVALLEVTNSWANNRDQLISLGDAAYVRKAYDSSIYYYEQAGGKSPDAVTLSKLGNAHYRLHHMGEAVLSYERALAQQPGFAAASKNVRVIQQQVSPRVNEVFFLRWWRAVTAAELSNAWAILAILIFATLLITMGWNYYRKQQASWQKPQFIAAALFIAIASVVFSLAGAWRDAPHAKAVVMTPDTKFRPTTMVKSTGINLPEGLLVKVLNAGKEDVIVSLPDGQEGFVQRSDIALVE
jgi:tetratricopeptide (TPR) repeat protein